MGSTNKARWNRSLNERLKSVSLSTVNILKRRNDSASLFLDCASNIIGLLDFVSIEYLSIVSIVSFILLYSCISVVNSFLSC